MSAHVHELPHLIELHFYRLDEKKDHDERLALVAYDRDAGIRLKDGTVNCPAIWFDQNGRAHNRTGILFRTAKSHGFIGMIHMSPYQAIDMIYRHAALVRTSLRLNKSLRSGTDNYAVERVHDSRF